MAEEDVKNEAQQEQQQAQENKPGEEREGDDDGELPELPRLVESLEELVRSGEISRERAAFARQKVEDLFHAIIKSKSARRTLTNDSLDLSMRLQAEIELLRKEQQMQSEDEITIDLLAGDIETATNESLICREREQNLIAEESDLRRAQEEFRKRIKQIEDEHAAALAPQMLQLKFDIEGLKKQIQEGSTKIEQCNQEIQSMKEKLSQIQKDSGSCQQLKKADFETLSSYDGLPEKLKKQGDALLSAVKGLHIQEQRHYDKIKDMESELVNLQNNKKTLGEEHTRSCADLEKLRNLMEQKELSAKDLKKELELATLEADQYLADRVNYDMQLKAAQLDHKHEQEVLAQHLKEKERILRKLKLVDSQLRTIQDSIPGITLEKDKMQHQVVIAENERKKVNSSITELKKEFDLQMRNYLGIETVSKDISSKLRTGHKEVERLEKEVLAAIEVEYATYQQMGDLASLRENTCRLLSSKIQLFNEAQEKIHTSNILIGFLKEKNQDIEDHYKKFGKLYNVMRAQRNKTITLIQAGKVTVTELRDKAKKLEVELNMLQGELRYKDKVLHRMRKEMVTGVQSRAHLRTELIKCTRVLRQQKETVDQKLIEEARMTGFIKMSEKEMSLFRREYELCVVDRNNVGVALIDRNDELCILYERGNVQEELLKISDIEMSKRINEVSFLRHEARGLERSILICYTFIPKARQLQSTIADLKDQLKRVRAESDRLTDLVEHPQNTARWKMLQGDDPAGLALRAKLSFVEETLSKKEGQSLEKDLIYEELSELADDIKKQAALNMQGNKTSAIQLSDYQYHLNTTSHRMMALVSELSLTQATAATLKREKESLEKMVEEGYAKLHEQMLEDQKKRKTQVNSPDIPLPGNISKSL